jgi:hypothetical protein
MYLAKYKPVHYNADVVVVKSEFVGMAPRYENVILYELGVKFHIRYKTRYTQEPILRSRFTTPAL